jgi:4-amino-4-deoxy-L-arabinose transferase
MTNLEADCLEAAVAAPQFGEYERFGSDAAAAPRRIDKQFVEQGVLSVKLQAVADGQHNVSDSFTLGLNEPHSAEIGRAEQPLDALALAVFVIAAGVVKLRHALQDARDFGRGQGQECYSQASMIGDRARSLSRMLWIALPLAWLLYFFRLDAVGLVGPDEPRYASIGREMARSGDWITPRLWGSPWFEKPALLYWMSGAAFRLGVGPDLAPRLPVALMASAFLVFYWWILAREFGCRAAWLATLILGTSAGWIVFSQTGTPDLPVTATFSTAMLLALPWIARRETRWLPLASAMLGLAVLAKSLPPLVLAAPVALRWRWWRDLARWRVVLPLVIVAAPWHVLCYFRNGRSFLDTLFVEHQFGRFTSGALMHTQPLWYYVPVLAGLLMPWTPAVAALARRGWYGDARRQFLLAWFLFGLVLFSISVNKLPGYVLPLLPAIAALMAVAFDEAEHAGAWLAGCAVALVAFPLAAPILPDAVANGLSRAPRPSLHWTWLLPALAAAAVWMLESRGRRIAGTALIAVGAAIGMVYIKLVAAPELNRVASARQLWQEIRDRAGEICVGEIDRKWRYGLNYYSVVPLPDCSQNRMPFRLTESGSAPPRLE